MKYGNLNFEAVEDKLELVAPATAQAITAGQLKGLVVAEIDPTLADTAAFCEKYDIGQDASANCVIVKAKRGDNITYAAVMVLATTYADVNGIVKRELNARKISFAPMDEATSLSSMEYGGINPIGLPADWPILVDERVAALDQVIIGSGVRKSKLLVSGKLLSSLPNAKVLNLVKVS